MIEVTSKLFRENCAISSIVKLQGMEWEDWCREKDEHVLFSLLDSNEDILSMTMLGSLAVWTFWFRRSKPAKPRVKEAALAAFQNAAR